MENNMTSNNETMQASVNNLEKMAESLSFSEVVKVIEQQMSGYGKGDRMSMMKLATMLIGSVTGKKNEYDLTFVREEGDRWYIDLPSWPWHHANLEMVCGADRMLEILSEGREKVRLLVKVAQTPFPEDVVDDMIKEGWIELTLIKSSLSGGATYVPRGEKMKNFYRVHPVTQERSPRTIWLCPVTLFVVGQYPKYFYAKVIN